MSATALPRPWAPSVRRRRHRPFGMVGKAVLLNALAGGSMLGAAAADGTAEKVILYGGAVTACAVLWRTVGRPVVAILRRTAQAVEALETLPAWRIEHDERIAAVEGELAITQQQVGRVDGKVDGVANDVAAIRRELGISDDVVRHPPAPPN